MNKIFFAVTLALSVAGLAAAQNTNKVEGFVGVSVTSFDTGLGNSGFVGANNRETAFGFDTSVTGYLNDNLGIEGNFDGHYKNKAFTFPSILGPVEAKLSSYNFLGGPHYRFSTSGKVTPFVRALAGANYSRVHNDSFTIGGITVGSSTETETDFALKVGGGVDIGVAKRAAIRLSADYNPIFQNGGGTRFGGSRTRNEAVLSIGILFK